LARHAGLPGGVVDLVVHVGDVGHERGVVPLVLEESLEEAEDRVRPGVAHVHARVDRGAAGVDAHAARIARLELAERLREGVLDADGARHQSARSTVATAMAAMPSPRPTKPIPSPVVNLTFTARASTPAACARAARIRSR